MAEAPQECQTLPIFGADADGAWLFTEEKLAEMRASAHSSAQESIMRFVRSSDDDSVGPSPVKKTKLDIDMITLAEDLILQVVSLSHLTVIGCDLIEFYRTIIFSSCSRRPTQP